MNGVLKVVRYLWVGGTAQYGKTVLLIVILSIVLSLFGIPAGVLSFAFLLFMFSPPGSFSDDPESRRIFGILPVRRSAVLAGEFFSIVVTILLGQLPAAGFLLLAEKKLLLFCLPEGLQQVFRSFSVEFSVFSVSILALSASLCCCVFSFLLMKLRIRGEGGVIIWAIIFMTLLGGGLIFLGAREGDAPADGIMAAAAVIAEFTAISVTAVCWAVTVKKTASKEY